MFCKLVIFFVAAVCVYAAPTDVVPLEKQQSAVIPIVSQSEELEPNGTYKFSYETGNGIKREETSFDKVISKSKSKSSSSEEGGEDSSDSDEIHVQQGSYSYTAPDGTLITLRYIADENGFQPIGDHIPKVSAPVSASSSLSEKLGRALNTDSVEGGSVQSAVVAQPQTAKPASAKPASAEPAPAEPTSVEPVPAESTPAEPVPALSLNAIPESESTGKAVETDQTNDTEPATPTFKDSSAAPSISAPSESSSSSEVANVPTESATSTESTSATDLAEATTSSNVASTTGSAKSTTSEVVSTTAADTLSTNPEVVTSAAVLEVSSSSALASTVTPESTASNTENSTTEAVNAP